MPLPAMLLEGKYEILAKIREGGMGAIYKVHHRLLDEIRVIKVMKPQLGNDPELQKRFALEAKTITRLKHPNIATINDFATDPDGTAFIVMEYIDGANLDEILRCTGPVPLALALEIAHQTLAALEYLHGKRVVHRDIAPDNIMLTIDESGRPLVKLIDLGIAKALDSTTAVTSTGIFLGKLKYSSPEQLGALSQGESLDGRSDQYSLGVVIYELLTAQRPIAGETTQELIASHLFKPPIPFGVSDPGGQVPPEIRALVLKALAKNRQDRFSSATELDRQIQAAQQKVHSADVLAQARAILSAVRRSSGGAPTVAQHVTPSAQDRFDRNFQPQATPLPATPMTQSETFVAPGPAPTESTAPSAHFEKRDGGLPTAAPTRRMGAEPRAGIARASRHRIGLRLVAGALVLALAGVVFFLYRSREAEPIAHLPGKTALKSETPQVSTPSRPAPSALSESGAASAAPSSPHRPAGPARLEETEAEPVRTRGTVEESPPRRSETHAEASPKTPQRASVRHETTRGAQPERQAPPAPSPAQVGAEQARYAAQVARRRADGVDAKNLAAAAYGQGLARQSDGQGSVARSDFADATTAFNQAADLFTQAEVSARTEAARRKAEAAKPAEAARSETAPPARAAPPPPTDQQRIRDVIARYQKAQSALDVGLYLEVAPYLAHERSRITDSFNALKSQDVQIDGVQIEVNGSRATARFHEQRSFIPRVGEAGRVDRQTVMTLQKSGNDWLITSLR